MTDPDPITGSEKLTSVFGHWPSFHDAEVVWLHLDRRGSDPGEGPTVEALIHAFEMTPEVDPAGYFVLRHHVLVHLRFCGVVDLRLEDVNHQNVLFDLRITAVPEEQADGGRLAVEFNSIYGVGAVFLCEKAAVVSVEPCDENGAPVRPEHSPDPAPP